MRINYQEYIAVTGSKVQFSQWYLSGTLLRALTRYVQVPLLRSQSDRDGWMCGSNRGAAWVWKCAILWGALGVTPGLLGQTISVSDHSHAERSFGDVHFVQASRDSTRDERDDFSDDEPASPRAGLLGYFEYDGTNHYRIDPSIAFSGIEAWQDDRLPQGAFSTNWQGQVKAQANGEFTFSLFAAGSIELDIDGQRILSAESPKAAWHHSEPIGLSFGDHRFALSYRSPAKLRQERTTGSPSESNRRTDSTDNDGEAAKVDHPRLGLFWRGPGFDIEPILPRYFSYVRNLEPSDVPADPVGLDQARALVRGLRCAACHTSSQLDDRPLAAPALTRLAGNLRQNWFVEHLTTPPGGLDLSKPASDPLSPYPDSYDSDDRSHADDPQADAWQLGHRPHFNLSESDASHIAQALWEASVLPSNIDDINAAAENEVRAEEAADHRSTDGDRIIRGQRLFAVTGCLACHRVDGLGGPKSPTSRLFAGGDLSDVASKRTEAFFLRWLRDPASINPDHRMPQFDLTAEQQLDLAAYLSHRNDNSTRDVEQGEPDGSETTRSTGKATDSSGDDSTAFDKGVALIERQGCQACHRLPEAIASRLEPVEKRPLTSDTDWSGGCMVEASDGGQHSMSLAFMLDAEQRTVLERVLVTPASSLTSQAEQLLRERNCYSCHQRNDGRGITQHFPDLAVDFPEIADEFPTLSPPPLTSVGDKLQRDALHKAIAGKEAKLRPWLQVQMPDFDLSDENRTLIVQHLISSDRIPDGAVERTDTQREPSDKATELAAGRLVTSEGFGCQSCHAIGSHDPVDVPLNARGTNLSELGKRLRESWFHRWTRNPSRIVPRMEMPSIQTAVPGVLESSLEHQLQALWNTLNEPGFEPPRANPERVVRNHNQPELLEPTRLVTNVIETPQRNYLRPLLFGLPNRHNILFDLERGELATWWMGDVARQHTRGKTWYWEPGSPPLLENRRFLTRILLVDADGQLFKPSVPAQVAVELDTLAHREQAMEWTGRLHLKSSDRTRMLHIKQRVQSESDSAFMVTTSVQGLAPGERLVVDFGTTADSSGSNRPDDPREPGLSVPRDQHVEAWIEQQLASGGAPLDYRHRVEFKLDRLLGVELWMDDGKLKASAEDGLAWLEASTGKKPVSWSQRFDSTVEADRFPINPMPVIPQPQLQLDNVPGYSAVQLPLPTREMPISMAWDTAGEMYIGSLKGRVLQVLDSDQDGFYDNYLAISDEFPAPYGLHAAPEGVDVLAKYGLLRLIRPEDTAIRPEEQPTPWDARVLADGWGYTDDYHDWAVGVRMDGAGNYYIALPCQQDDRSQAAARYRGEALRLIPDSTQDGHREYRIESIAAGLRFPMGIALSDDGELFATDNQGNYNPFNELNHVREGKRYGFINKLDRREKFSPPFESPAINLPHPWTRSVNGICFLRTPAEIRGSRGELYGPYEGHLIGCEMNQRCLIRMSLQRVGDTYQGAAYLFSRLPRPEEVGFEGPIVCEVAPDGDIYVGNLLDSGWGGGQNTGSIVRLRPVGELPVGIAEMRALSDGFELSFSQPVDPELAVEQEYFDLRSYRRISTPAYGGDDRDSRGESIRELKVAADGHSLSLKLDEMREGFVYELNIGAIGSQGQDLFPSQAHYTLRSIPQ